MGIVSTDWLRENHSKVKIIDSSWHMPYANRNAFNEYNKEHIENAIFFDIDKNSNKKNQLPHMLPEEEKWEKIVSALGISNSDKIVIYDNSDVLSSCRCWYTFIFFGHDPNLISVLNGGFSKWKKENKKTTNKKTIIANQQYQSQKKIHLVKTKKEIDDNILNKEFKIVDARSKNRFLGLEKESRPGLRSGSIENSYCLPFADLINKKDKTFKNKHFIKKKFKEVGIFDENNVVFSCGSGITAAVLALAYSMINDKYSPTVYDGSWAEYDMII